MAELVDLCVLVEDAVFFLWVGVVLSCARGRLLDQISRQARTTIKRLTGFTGISVARLFLPEDDKSFTESIPARNIRKLGESVS